MSDSNFIYLLSTFTFIGIVALVEAVYFFWRGSHSASSTAARKRLRNLSAGGGEIETAPSLLRRQALSSNPVLNQIYMSVPRLKHLDKMLERASLKINISQFLLIVLGVFLLVFVVIFAVIGAGAPLAFLAAIIVAPILPYVMVGFLAQRNLDAFNKQLPDAIDFIARSLRAGNPFSASLKAVSEDMSDPIASEFGITFDEMRYGVDAEDALQHLAERTDSEEIRFFVTAVLVQRTTGGNLAKILDRLSAVMRARAATFREIIVLSSEMRYSANILIALPFVVALAMTIVQPDYLNELFESSTGLMLVVIQLFLILVGYIIIRKMVNFRV